MDQGVDMLEARAKEELIKKRKEKIKEDVDILKARNWPPAEGYLHCEGQQCGSPWTSLLASRQ